MRYLLLALALCACERTSAAPSDETSTTEVSPPGPRLIAAGDGDVATLVKAERARASGPLLVYIGAEWCEPCRYFKQALHSPELIEAFPDLRLLEFDLDRDADRLRDAGYGGKLIPRFVIPEASGRAGAFRMEGSIKGPEAVANIMPRLRSLLAQP